jgi:hydrogenase expression/formation protein HypE
MGLQPGKLPHAFLKRMIRYSGSPDRRVIMGPRIGEDAAVVDLGGECLILKTDPITYAVDEIGWYAVHVNANDIATMGARPKWLQVSLLLPQEITRKRIESIFEQIDRACKGLGIAVTGGHTEVNPWIDRPIIVGDMHGLCKKKDLVFTAGAKEGDSIVLTKGAGIEGTAVLAREKKAHLLQKFSEAFVRRAGRYLYDPGISVVPEALIGARLGANSMHDPTEGGVATGLYEISTASGKGLTIEEDAIIVRDETRRICDFFGLDPLGLMGSGALLLTLPPRRVDAYLDAVKEEGVEASVIGQMTKKSAGMKIIDSGRTRRLRFSQRDEILKVL